MEPFTVYYKMCDREGAVHEAIAVGFFTEGEGGVHFKDGAWNPIESTYLTKAQAEKHFCNCIGCQAQRLPDERKYQPCADCKKTQEVLKVVKDFFEDL